MQAANANLVRVRSENQSSSLHQGYEEHIPMPVPEDKLAM